MTPEQAISSLDRQLAAHGTVTLRRRGSPDDDKVLRAKLSVVGSETVVGDVRHHEYDLIISPTGIGTWPGGAGPQPPKVGDLVLIDDVPYGISKVSPVRLGADNTLVRVNLTCGPFQRGRS